MTAQSTQLTARLMVAYTARLLIAGVMLAALLFAGAGSLNWPLGWAFVIFWIVSKPVLVVLMGLRSPELLAERTTSHENTPRYDRIILPLYFVFCFGTFLIAGLDRRWGWSGTLPAPWIILGALVYLVGNAVPLWAILSNPYFSDESRIQSDRGQRVSTGGPYRYVRHPSYAATMILWPASALFLGSWWALIPGAAEAIEGWIASGATPNRVRKTFFVGTHAVAATGLLVGALAPPQIAVASLFVVAIGLGAVGPHIFATGQTLAGPKAAGKWVGIQNGWANFAGILGPIFTGVIVDRTGAWEGAFLLAAGFTVIGVVAWSVMIRKIEPIVWDARPGA